MDGVYFYWFSWMIWIISTFFMKKTSLRLKIAVLVLFLIILSAYSLTIKNYTINIGLVFLLFYGYSEIAHRAFWKLIYFYFTTLTVTLGYVSFCLFELIDPVWLFIDHKWLLSIGLANFVIVLQKSVKDRLLCLVLSACHGEILYAFIIRRLNAHTDLGSLAFFDILSISLFLVLVWCSLEYISIYFNALYAQRNIREKTKQS